MAATSPERSWRGKVAVVTGAASGIGLAMARRFAAERMAVVLSDLDAARLDVAAEVVRDDGAADVLVVVTDVRQEPAVQALADAVATALGDVHLLCNNAGVIRPGTAWETSAQDWAAIMDTNVGGVMHGIRTFVPRMLAHGDDCHVVNTASAAGLFAASSFAAYCASKAAVIALTEVLADEVAGIPGTRLGVSVLCPGGVVTDLFRAEAERRSVDGAPIGEETARRWATFADAARTDQVPPELIAEHVWRAVQDRSFWIVPMQPNLKAAALARLRRIGDALGSAAPVGGSPSAGVLARYYERVDGPAPESAIDLVSEALVFSLVRPDRRIEGTRRDLAAYIEGRARLSHRIVRTASTSGVELALGETVDGDAVLGTFVAAVRADASGRIDRYVASFHPDLRFDLDGYST